MQGFKWITLGPPSLFSRPMENLPNASTMKQLPNGILCPDGSRLTVLGTYEIKIFQQHNGTHQWDEIVSIRDDRGDKRRRGFNSFDWADAAGTMFAIGDSSEPEPGAPTAVPPCWFHLHLCARPLHGKP